MPESHSETVALAVRAATEWIEAATGRRFPPDRTFRATLEDGVLLCELMDNLSPGLLRHTPHLNNVERFLMGCKDLGMSKEQLFEETDLRDPSLQDQSRDKRKSLNERLKSVCLTLFWLSQIADYSGPQLELTPFTALFPDHQVRPPFRQLDNLFLHFVSHHTQGMAAQLCIY
jgi:F-box protein 20